MERHWESLVQFLSSTILARQGCLTPPFTKVMDGEKDITEEYWAGMAQKHTDQIRRAESLLPSGSGFDSGTRVDLDASHSEKIVLYTSFHHMDENGFYCGWTDHTVTVTPSFWSQMHLRITGRNLRGIRDYIHEVFYDALSQPITEYEEGVRAK